MIARSTVLAAASAAILAFACPAFGADDNPKPDLSTPRSAFEAFAAKADEMQAIARDLKGLFLPHDGRTFARAITPGFAEFLEKREEGRKTHGNSDTEGKMVFDKVETLEEDLAAVVATQKNTVSSAEKDPATGESKETSREEARRHRLLYRKIGDSWRIEKWLKECRQCRGSGKCPACDGTGTVPGRDCPGCKGAGKTGDGGKCALCDGSGKTKPSACGLCRRTGGKCMSCRGEGWVRQDNFESNEMFLNPAWKVEPFMDLSTPEAAARTFFNLKDQDEIGRMNAVSKVVEIIRSMIDGLFVPETAAKFAESVKASTEKFAKAKEESKREFGSAEIKDDAAVVEVTETVLDRRGRERSFKRLLKLARKDGSWLVDDRGSMCWSCNGSGVCPQCKGTCKDPAGGECFSCKETGGKCPECRGGKVIWEREAGK